MAGEARPSPAYYVALSLLAVGLLAGLSLFLLLTTRPSASNTSVRVTGPLATSCTVGGHGTVCYRFTVTNTGNGPAYATCQVTPASGTQATFDDGLVVKPVNLLEEEANDLTVSVVADESSTLAEPSVSCAATSA
jgi:hypothetical protein